MKVKALEGDWRTKVKACEDGEAVGWDEDGDAGVGVRGRREEEGVNLTETSSCLARPFWLWSEWKNFSLIIAAGTKWPKEIFT